MGWLIALGVLILLAMLPLGIRLDYNADGVRVTLHVGPVKYTLYPGKKQRNQEQEEPEQKKAVPTPATEAKGKKKESGGKLTDFMPLVKTILDLLCDLRRKIRVKELYLRLILASSDPADLAISYGRAWAALGNLMPQLEQLFRIQKRDVEVECDFTASETRCVARLDVTITLGRLLALAVVYGIRTLKEYKTMQTKRKGGAAL